MSHTTKTPPTTDRNRLRLHNRRLRLTLALATFLGLGLSGAQAATKYWDTTAGAGNGVGGTGTWSAQGTSIFSTVSTGSASLTSAATTDDDIFQGTAGTITLGANITANSYTFNTTGYNITGSFTLTGATSLANSVNLTLGNGETGNVTLGVGSVSGGTGSTLTINGAATGSNLTRVNLAAVNANISVPITITGTGFVNIAGTATGTQVSGNITGNGSRLNLIATSGNDITFGGTINNGTGTVRIAAGSSGGAGVVVLSGSGNTWGATELNNASGGILRMGAVNALPTATTLTFGATSGNGNSIVELSGKNTTIGQLTNGAQSGGTLRNTSGTAATLTISGSDTSAAAFSGSIQDGTGAGALSLIRSGTGTTTLSGSNSYTGTTQINGGTLNVSGSITGTGAVSLTNANSTLVTGSATTIGGTITANNGTILTIGGVGTVGTLTSGALTLNGGSALNFDLLGGSNYDKINTSGALTLGSGTETINIVNATAGTFTLLSGYTSLAGAGAFALGSSLPSGFNYSLAIGSTSTVLTVSSLGGSANVTWSLSGLAPTSSTDGAGTWTNGGTNFYNTDTSASTTWDNTGTYNLTVGSGGAGGTITLGGNVTVGGTLTFASVTAPYTIGASGDTTHTLTLVGGITANNSATINAPTILAASQTWNVTTGTLTANGAISETGGARALTKDGAGMLVLTSTSNSYSGGTTVSNGTLSISSGSSTGSGNVIVSSGATLAGAGTVNGTTSVTSGTINGSGLTLTGAATFGGTGNNLNGTVTSVGGTLLSASSDLTVNGTLTVTGNTVGPVAPVAVTINGNNSTLTNLGTINQTGTVAAGTGGRAVFNNTSTGVVITNGSATNSTALIQTADGDVVRSNVGGVTLNNYGTLTSLNAAAGGSQAVDFNPITSGSNIINNYATGIMQVAEADAVRPGVNGFVNNDGLIKSTTTTGSSSDGVDAQTNTGLTIANAASAGSGTGTGTIEGGRHGITGGNVATDSNGNPTVNNGAYSMNITNNLGGTIKGDNGSGLNIDGLNANELVTIVNHGTITGNGHDIGDNAGHDGDGVDVDGLVNLTNTGTIKSINAFGFGETEFSEGVTVGGGTIINSGLIQGSVTAGNTTAVGRGITIAGVDKLLTTDSHGVVTETAIPAQAPYAATTITNQTGGQIIGDSDSAIIFSSGLASGFSHTITNQTGALIQTGSTTAPAILMAADDTTLNNSGTIDGSSSGKAITIGSGKLTLNIQSGTASILGNIDGGTGGASSLVVDPGSGNTFSYAGTITHFATAQIASGTFSLSGSMTAGGTAVNGGTLAGSGTVTGLVTVTTGGVISPGNSPGKLTLQTGVDFSGGGKYFWQLASLKDDATGAAGTDFDQILLTGGNLTLGGTSVLTLDFSLLSGSDPNSTDSFWQSNHSWTIIDENGATNTGNTNFSQISDPTFADGVFSTSTDPSGDSVLNYQATPEPGSVCLLAFGALGLFTRRRRV